MTSVLPSWMTWVSRSVTRPRAPSDPSSVVITAVRPLRRAVSAPNTRSALAAPSRKSTAQPRPRSLSPRANSGALPYPPPTSSVFTGSRGNGKGRPSGPARSSVSLVRRPDSHRVPGPATANTNSTVPPWSGRTSWMENARRSSIEVSGPPTATATNWPGRNRAATPGAITVIAKYASTRRTVSTVPLTCAGTSDAPGSARSAIGMLTAQRLRVFLQRPHTHLTTRDRFYALHGGGQALDRGHARNPAPDRGGADLVPVQPRPGLTGAAERRVHDQVDLAVQDLGDDVRLATGTRTVPVLPDDRGTNSVAPKHLTGGAGDPDLEPQLGEPFHREDHLPLVHVRHRHERPALDRQGAVGGRLGLRVSGA